MKTLLSIIALFILWGVDSAAWAGDPSIAWKTSVEEAWKDAQAQKRPVLIYLKTEQCSFCRTLERDTFGDPGVAGEVQRAFIPLEVEADKEPEIASRLGLRGFPATVVVSHETGVVDVIRGYVPPATMKSRLQSALSKMRK